MSRPAATVPGRPARPARVKNGDVPGPGAARGHARRAAITASMTSSRKASSNAPGPSTPSRPGTPGPVEPGHRPDRGQWRQGQRPAKASTVPPSTGIARTGHGPHGLGPGSAQGRDDGDRRGRPGHHGWASPCPGQDDQPGQGGQGDRAQRHRLGPDGLLDLAVHTTFGPRLIPNDGRTAAPGAVLRAVSCRCSFASRPVRFASRGGDPGRATRSAAARPRRRCTRPAVAGSPPAAARPPRPRPTWSTGAGGISASAATRNERWNGPPRPGSAQVGHLEQVGDAGCRPPRGTAGPRRGQHDLIRSAVSGGRWPATTMTRSWRNHLPSRLPR